MKRIILVFINLTWLIPLPIQCQIMNGGFEEWSMYQDSSEYPTYWNASVRNADESLSQSTLSIEGLYSLNLSSRNFIEGTFGPAYSSTKFKPATYSIIFKFNYLIDSISGPCNAVIQFYQKNDQSYHLISSNSFNEKLSNFKEEEISLQLPSLDTIRVDLIAQNHQIIFGYDGYISVLFDAIELVNLSATDFITEKECGLISNLVYNNRLNINNKCACLSDYKIFSINGSLIKSGALSNDEIVFQEKGLFIIGLYNTHELKYIFRFINL